MNKIYRFFGMAGVRLSKGERSPVLTYLNMEKYNFERVRIFASKSGDCVVCGRKCTRISAFEQNISPIILNEDGSKITREEMIHELRIEVAEWKALPIIHSRCNKN